MMTKFFTFCTAALLLNVQVILAHSSSADQPGFDGGTYESNRPNETDPTKIQYDIIAGLQVGGASPLSMPAEIRQIQKFNLKNPYFLGVRMHYPIHEQWGLTTGLTFNGKGMHTKASVKGYKTTFNAGDLSNQNLRGYYTGDITTTVENLYLSIPLLASYRISPKWDVKAGPYLAYAIQKSFTGEASNGYLRSELPTGDRIQIDLAAYDFSDHVRNIDVGLTLAANYNFCKKFSIMSQLDYGFNSIMKTGFETISFGLHNTYLNVGIGYCL